VVISMVTACQDALQQPCGCIVCGEFLAIEDVSNRR
jgi:hypothetical protein